MFNLSIIDIGSNTIHLLIVEITNKDRFRILYEDKEHLRLGSELAMYKKISNTKIAETIAILKKYLVIASSFNSSEIIAVATEALRVAENSHYILDLIHSKLELPIRLLSSREEAYLAFLGVKNHYNIPKGLIVDSGGASTEFIGVKSNSFITSTSIPLGAINVTENLKLDFNGKYLSCQYTEEYFFKLFSNIKWMKDFQGSTLIGIGGTFKNLKSVYTHLSNSLLPNKIITEISPKELNLLCDALKNMTLADRKVLKGLSPKRSDIILGGCEIIQNFVDYLNFDKIIITEAGIRTGLLYHYLDHLYNHDLCSSNSSIS